ncbi:MAG TPA: TetR/AcrR family transcriptional regulator [Thermoanaerobaculia bacterium]|jgi:TetR/AcrR family fatty acid metabolism transcriptional regulator
MNRAARVTTRKEEPKLWQEFKRQSIQAAVVRLMCREGLGAVTMERVAQEVGIAKGTVYLHYRDKQELLESVKESSLDPLTLKVEQVFSSALAPRRKLETFALRYLTYFDENRDLFRILLYEREVTRAQGSRYRHDRYRRLVDSIAAVIGEGIDDGAFRDVPARKAAAMLLESVVAIVNQRLLADEADPVEDDARLVADIFLRGLEAKKK